MKKRIVQCVSIIAVVLLGITFFSNQSKTSAASATEYVFTARVELAK